MLNRPSRRERPHYGERLLRAPATARYADCLWLLDSRPKNIYVAATLGEQETAAKFALSLRDAGFHVTSRWLRKDFSDRPDASAGWVEYDAYEAAWGEIDLDDLRVSDTLIVLAHQPSATGGYHVELGYFLGAGRTNIIVVGERPNVFYFTSNVRYTRTTDGLVDWLRSEEHGKW